jgi:ATP synthase protein I
MTDPKKKDDFDHRLAAARHRQEAKFRPKQSVASMSGAAVGFRIVVEILAAIAVGVGIGIVLDLWLGTKPWMLILFCMLGFGGAILNVMRTARDMDRRTREAKQAASQTGFNETR